MADRKNRYKRGMFISFFLALVSGLYLYSFDEGGSGSSMHLMASLLCAVGVGFFAFNLLRWLRSKRNKV